MYFLKDICRKIKNNENIYFGYNLGDYSEGSVPHIHAHVVIDRSREQSILDFKPNKKHNNNF